MESQAKHWIDKLELHQHPEGGYYKELYRSTIPHEDRDLFTSIYFLLPGSEYSHFHQIKSDEIWYFHRGSSLLLHEITPNGEHISTTIGNDGELSYLVKAGHCFASECSDKEGFSLVSCMVSPGFDFEDFTLNSYEELSSLYPQHKELIKRLS